MARVTKVGLTGAITRRFAPTVPKFFRMTMFAADGVTPMASKTGLWWAWWSSLAAVRTAVADAAGTGAATDGSGQFQVSAPFGLSAGDNQGYGIVSDQDASPDAAEVVYAGTFNVGT